MFELVRDVDDMHGERTLDIAAAECDVEIAEWRRMRRGLARAEEDEDERGSPEIPEGHRAALYRLAPPERITSSSENPRLSTDRPAGAAVAPR